VKIGYVQYDVDFGHPRRNMTRAEELIREASEADLLVLPELGFTGYDFVDTEEVHEHAEYKDEGDSLDFMRDLAAELSMTLVLGYPEKTTRYMYNSCRLVTPDGDFYNYRKMHLFSREKELFLPGDQPPPIITTPAGRVGVMICFDWFFPETARLLALGGAQIIAHPSNLVLQYCQRAMYARSIENRVFTITANRTGTEDRAGRELTFTGASQVVSPQGEYLVQATEDGMHAQWVDVDPGLADDKYVTDHNMLWEDRRTELYRGLV